MRCGVLVLLLAVTTSDSIHHDGSDVPVGEKRDALFTFDGVAGLREKHCVPADYQLPDRIQNITAECLSEARDSLATEPEQVEARGSPDLFRSPGNSLRKLHLSIRDCMADKMGYVDDSGEFIAEKLEEEIASLQFPESFERDVQSASRACLFHMPAGLSTERRQDFYYVCRDSLLEVNCLYHRLSEEEPDRALDIGIQQTKCLNDVKPSENVANAMAKCKDIHDVPVKYATLKRKRSVDVSMEEGSGVEESSGAAAEEAPPKTEDGGFVPVLVEEEKENNPSVSDRVNLFVHCVHREIGALEGDHFNAARVIEQLQQFHGEDKYVQLQVSAATRCQEATSLETFNLCYYDNISSGCHIFQVQDAFLAGDPSLLPKYE